MGNFAIIFSLLLFILYYLNNFGKPKKISRIILLFFLGFFSLLASSYVQQIFMQWGIYPDGEHANGVLSFIICIGLVEEFFKLVCIQLMRNKNKADIFLSAFVIALTFATLENFAYVSDGTSEIGFLRSILPFHLVCQVIMSYFLYKAYDDKQNRNYSHYFLLLILALLLPSILHGIFDYIFYSVSNDNLLSVVLIFAIIGFSIIFLGMKYIAKMSNIILDKLEQRKTRNMVIIGINIIYIVYVLLFVLNGLV